MAAVDQVTELVFLTPPAVGHLLPTIQIAERLIAQSSSRISAVIPIMKSPYSGDKINSYLESRQKSTDCRLTLLDLPPPTEQISSNTLSSYIGAYKSVIEQTLLDRYQSSSGGGGKESQSPPPPLSGIVLDLFCAPLMDIADKLNAPSYIFFISGAAFLSLMFRLEALDVDVPAVFGNRPPDDDTVIEVSGFKNPVPLNVWPRVFLDLKGGGGKRIIGCATTFRRTKGIMLNTFMELESSFIQSLSSSSSSSSSSSDASSINYHGLGQIPPIYPVGPILNTTNDDSVDANRDQVMAWLDCQPDSSVVFLCFGSEGSFNEEQVKEIATGLERSGHRFLWSLRKRPVENSGNPVILQTPREYEDVNEVLPEGFLERTAGVGKLIGWAPQVAVLNHKAVGAFVSHCGWNSTLESMWFGVPMLTWPLFAEQQLNAFVLVKELGLALEIKMDYECDSRKGVPNMIVKAEEVEMGIRKMMEGEEGERVRRKVKQISEEGRKALGVVSGSSYQSITRFLEDVLSNYG